MIKANGSIIATNREALMSREHPYLKYRTELPTAALRPLIMDVEWTCMRDRVHTVESASQAGIPSAEGFPHSTEYKKNLHTV